MILLYMDHECEIFKINCIDFADAVNRFKSCKKKWPHMKLVCIANAEYLKEEKVKIRFEHEKKGLEAT